MAITGNRKPLFALDNGVYSIRFHRIIGGLCCPQYYITSYYVPIFFLML